MRWDLALASSKRNDLPFASAAHEARHLRRRRHARGQPELHLRGAAPRLRGARARAALARGDAVHRRPVAGARVRDAGAARARRQHGGGLQGRLARHEAQSRVGRSAVSRRARDHRGAERARRRDARRRHRQVAQGRRQPLRQDRMGAPFRHHPDRRRPPLQARARHGARRARRNRRRARRRVHDRRFQPTTWRWRAARACGRWASRGAIMRRPRFWRRARTRSCPISPRSTRISKPRPRGLKLAP